MITDAQMKNAFRQAGCLYSDAMEEEIRNLTQQETERLHGRVLVLLEAIADARNTLKSGLEAKGFNATRAQVSMDMIDRALAGDAGYPQMRFIATARVFLASKILLKHHPSCACPACRFKSAFEAL